MLKRLFADAQQKSDDRFNQILIRKFPGASASDPYSSTSGRQLTPGFSHASEQLNHYRGYSYAIIRLISSRIAGQPIHFAQDVTPLEADAGVRFGRPMHKAFISAKVPENFRTRAAGSQLVESHECVQLMERPNPIMCRFNFLFTTMASLEITGQAFWWMIRAEDSEDGKPAIWPIPTPWMRPNHRPKLFSSWIMRPPGHGEPIELPAESVAYFNYPNPADPLGSISPMQALAKTVTADESIETAQYRAFINGTNPGLAVVIGKLQDPSDTGIGSDEAPVLTKAQRQGILAQFKAHYAGVMKSDEPLIIDGFVKDVKRITQNNREMDFLNSGIATKGRLAQGWGVNPVSMGERDVSGRSASAVSDDHLTLNVINPRLEMCSQILTTRVIPYFTGDSSYYAFFELAKAKDAEYELSREQAMMGSGALTINEWREAHGLRPFIDGNMVLVPGIGLIPVEIKDDTEGSIEFPSLKRDWSDWKKSGFSSAAESFSESRMTALLTSVRQQYQSSLQADLTSFFINIGEKMAPVIEGYLGSSGSIPSSGAEMLFHDSEFLGSLKDFIRPRLLKIANQAATVEYELYIPRRSLDNLEMKSLFDFTKLPGRIIRSISESVSKLLSFDFWGKILETIRGDLGEAISRTSSSGRSGTDAARQIVSDVFGPLMSSERAGRIAEVEADAAANSGQYVVAEDFSKLGIAKRRQWITRLDSLVRDTHFKAYAQIAAIGQPFMIGGYPALFPKDPSLPPKERCRCRCVAVTLIE